MTINNKATKLFFCKISIKFNLVAKQLQQWKRNLLSPGSRDTWPVRPARRTTQAWHRGRLDIRNLPAFQPTCRKSLSRLLPNEKWSPPSWKRCSPYRESIRTTWCRCRWRPLERRLACWRCWPRESCDPWWTRSSRRRRPSILGNRAGLRTSRCRVRRSRRRRWCRSSSTWTGTERWRFCRSR